MRERSPKYVRWAPLLAVGLAAAVVVAMQAVDDNGRQVASSDPDARGGEMGGGEGAGGEKGVQVVGRDIEPGLYVSTVPPGSGSGTCSWERIEDVEARYAVPVAGNEGPAGAQVVVEILESDSGFRSSGCGEWRPYAPPDSVSTSITSGTWLVGTDIAPGRYRSKGPAEASKSCEWSRQRGLSNSFFDIVESGQARGSVTVTIAPEDVSFTSSSCADWTPVSER